MDGSLDMEQKEEQITKWAKEQIDSLLAQTEGNTLRAQNGVLEKEDFLILVNIIENRIKVFLSEEKANNQKKREAIIAERGLDSLEYFERLLQDVDQLSELEQMKLAEVIKLANVSLNCIEASFEDHCGDENNIQASFVKNHIEILNFYPFKNEKSSANKEEALAKYLKPMNAVMDRFAKEDTLGRVTSVLSFIKCLDQAAVDVAAQDGLSEADYRALVHDHDLLEDPSVM